MKYNIPERVLKDISAFARKYSINKVILFGSRARGDNTERSDIDIAVYGGDFDSFYWDIKEKVHSLLSFDVVEADKPISEELKQEIEKDGVIIYEKAWELFELSWSVKKSDFEMADNNDIYRTGVIGQFNLTFELAWKALQEILKMHGADGAATGSPREILQLGYKLGFVDDAAVWLLMLKKRNTSVHIYNEQEVDEMILLIRDSFIPAFVGLEKTLRSKLEEVKNDWE